jgi:hypothetical protein
MRPQPASPSASSAAAISRRKPRKFASVTDLRDAQLSRTQRFETLYRAARNFPFCVTARIFGGTIVILRQQRHCTTTHESLRSLCGATF